MTETILAIDDDPVILRLVEYHLSEAGFATVTAANGAEAIDAFERLEPATVILDLLLPDADGKDLLERFHRERPAVPVVVMTARDDVDEVVECMRLGAIDFVQKPFEETRFLTAVRNAVTQARLRARVEQLTSELRQGEGFRRISGKSPAIRKLVAMLQRAAASEVTVLLTGESGTGKEVAARAIHAESERRDGPFVAVNCGAIPEGLIESELFGHEKGAFTGASATRRGSFEQAHGGTIFLDEIGELRSDLQVRLLRVLQEHKIQRVGGTGTIDIDVRVIAASNRDLRSEVARSNFREDLYYRLAVFPVVLPALRDRGSDVLILAHQFVRTLALANHRDIGGLTDEARLALERYQWPGNVRELENVIERAIILEDGPMITLASLPAEVAATLEDDHTGVVRGETAPADVGELERPRRQAVREGPMQTGSNVRDAQAVIVPFEEEERRIILRALELTHWNVQEASARLRLGRATIYRKIERYGLRASGATQAGAQRRSEGRCAEHDDHHDGDRRLQHETDKATA
jgi:DNA-binding NtrC family response regulator